MDGALLENWRGRVAPTDTVYILGDLFAYAKRSQAILEQLTGHLILIEGNHDALWLQHISPMDYFEAVCPQLEIEDRGRLVRMVHEPDLEQLPERGYLLYGHVHNNPWHHPQWPQLRAEDRALNVGADIALSVGGFFSPATLEEWMEYNRVFKELYYTSVPEGQQGCL